MARLVLHGVQLKDLPGWEGLLPWQREYVRGLYLGEHVVMHRAVKSGKTYLKNKIDEWVEAGLVSVEGIV